MNIKLFVDATDHFIAICPKCGKAMQIKNVETYIVQGDKCTAIHFICKNKQCWWFNQLGGYSGIRKIYWNDDEYGYWENLKEYRQVLKAQQTKVKNNG